MKDDKKNIFGFVKNVVKSATTDQEDKDSVGYKIGDAIEKTTESIYKGLGGK